MRRWLARRPAALSYRTVAQTRGISSATFSSNHTASEPPTSASNLPSQNGHESYALEARGLLRALLRECSYLPDSFAQQWVKQHIYSCFRPYETEAHCQPARSVSGERILKKLRDGRRALSKLQRANDGDVLCLQKVLMAVYGRTGKRRRELLRPLLQLSEDDKTSKPSQSDRGATSPAQGKPPADIEPDLPDADQESPAIPPDSSSTRLQPQTLPPQLKSLLLSQMQHGPPALTRSNPRRLQPVVPELNAWLRPMPQNRVKNIHKEHYAKLLSQALPPISQAVWERLRDLACGKAKLELPNAPRDKDVPARAAGRAGMDALDVVVRYGKVPGQLKRRSMKDPISKRGMRRIYAKVFSQCPLMEYDEGKREWRVTWGDQAILERSKAAA